MRFYPFLLLLTGLISCNRNETSHPDFSGLQWVDLTHSFDSATLYWPNNPEGFRHPEQFAGKTPLGYYYSSYTYSAPEHGGTHLDAPVHFAEGKTTADEVPLDRLTGHSVVVDVSDTAALNRDYLVSVSALERWEKVNGTIPEKSIVLFHTSYGKYYPDRLTYFGTALSGAGAIPQLHFPGISPEAAEWLVSKRNVKAVGLDTPSLDRGQSPDFRTHRILMEADVPGFENVANLDQVPATGAFIIALPMKIRGGSGGPLRIVAALPGN